MRAWQHAQRMPQLVGGRFDQRPDGGPTGVGSAIEERPFREWKAIGPTNAGGRTLWLAIDPLSPNTVYAGAASGGLWRSTTGGVGAAAWERIDTGHPVLGVSCISFEPARSDVIYIGTGEVYNHGSAGNLEADRATRGSYGVGDSQVGRRGSELGEELSTGLTISETASGPCASIRSTRT